MKLKITSTQTYETHTETVTHEYECEYIENESIIIKYSDGIIEIIPQDEQYSMKYTIIINGKTITQMLIKLGIESDVEYKTEYGIIKLKILGEEITYNKKEKNGKIKYKITTNGISYLNEIELKISN